MLWEANHQWLSLSQTFGQPVKDNTPAYYIGNITYTNTKYIKFLAVICIFKWFIVTPPIYLQEQTLESYQGPIQHWQNFH